LVSLQICWLRLPPDAIARVCVVRRRHSALGAALGASPNEHALAPLFAPPDAMARHLPVVVEHDWRYFVLAAISGSY
jgi:hypothetical protein